MTDPRVLVWIATVLVVTVATTPTRTRAVQNPLPVGFRSMKPKRRLPSPVWSREDVGWQFDQVAPVAGKTVSRLIGRAKAPGYEPRGDSPRVRLSVVLSTQPLEKVLEELFLLVLRRCLGSGLRR